ncbi:MAG: AraC family transcriptional regulator [Pyrinomonadaceae bacterium]
MQIEWKSQKEPPYLFRQVAEWSGIKLHRARVRAGKMLEHEPEHHEINVSLSGAFTTTKMNAAGRKVAYFSGKNNVCVTPAGQPVSAYWKGPIDDMGIMLDPDFVRETAAENNLASRFEFVEVYKNEDPLIAPLGLALLDEAASENAMGKLYADSLIQTLTLHVLRSYSTASAMIERANGGLSGYKLRTVKEFIDANLDSDLGLAEIAAVANLSQFHFARAFRKTTGVTPQQYLMERRIERAKQLLATDDLPIVEISLLTGFKNQSHFTTLFRKFTNLTPKTWRDLKLA